MVFLLSQKITENTAKEQKTEKMDNAIVPIVMITTLGNLLL